MNALVPVSATPVMSVSDVERVAMAIAQGGLFGNTNPNAVLTLCLLAQAEGQHPAVVFRDYHLIQGKPAKKAEAMLRDFVASGGKVEWHELSDEIADATFSHPGGGSARIDWTMKRAQAAGLATPMWKKYPRQMLRSRVVSEGVRTVFPGATSGLYVPEEVADMTGAEAPVTVDAPANETMGEFSDAPDAPVKVPGISKIKQRLNAFMLEGNKPETTLEHFRALVKANKDDIKAIRDAKHAYWTGDGSDFGEGFEGFEKWMARRYAELTPPEASELFKQLVESVNQLVNPGDVNAFLQIHGDAVGELDGEESRKFEAIFDDRAAIIKSGKVPLVPANA